MSRPLRFIPGQKTLVEVTTRTVHSRLLLRPSHVLNEIVLWHPGLCPGALRARRPCCGVGERAIEIDHGRGSHDAQPAIERGDARPVGLGGERGLQHIGVFAAQCFGGGQGSETPADQQTVSARAVLLGDRDGGAVRPGAHPEARRLDLHQGEEAAMSTVLIGEESSPWPCLWQAHRRACPVGESSASADLRSPPRGYRRPRL
jgi:hypothetical protein